MKANPNEVYNNMEFIYFDLPYWMKFWKKGERGALLYFYLWQMFLPLFVIFKKVQFDIAHNVNFHNDWTPSFLWVLGKPMVWGPVGHHPLIKPMFLKNYGLKVKLKNKITWVVKNFFWKLDPFLWLSKKQASKVLCMNSSVVNHLKGIDHKHVIMPSVSSEEHLVPVKKESKKFNVLSVGRLIPLKGFDLTIKAFHEFVSKLSLAEQANVQLTIVGSGSHEDFYKRLARDLKMDHLVTFISWIDRLDLMEIYKESDLFLFPSHEGAGMVVSEALSFGLPVVTLDNIGPGEFVDDTSGRKVKTETYDQTVMDLGYELYDLYENREELNKLSKGAVERHKEHFCWDKRGEVLSNIYLELIKENTIVKQDEPEYVLSTK